MNVKDYASKFEYNHWANRRLMEVVLQLPDEEFTKVVAGTYGSIRNTMVHILNAEWVWLEHCGGTPRGPKLEDSEFPTATSLQLRWKLLESHVGDFLASLRNEDLNKVIEFRLGSGPLMNLPCGEILQHALIHSAHHRGQISVLLRALGKAPGNFDFLFYALEQQSIK